MTSTLVLLTAEDDDFEIIQIVVEVYRIPANPIRDVTPRPVHRPKYDQPEVVINEETIVEDHLYLVESIVKKMKLSLPFHINYDDLHSIGIQGLMAAASRFNPALARKFKSYACMRITGAVKDELRRMDTSTRRGRARSKKIDQAILAVEARVARDATEDEIAQELGIKVFVLRKWRRDVVSKVHVPMDGYSNADGEPVSIHEFLPDANDTTGRDNMEQDEAVKIMIAHVSELPPHMKRVLSSYYFDGKRLQDIAKEVGLTESRICQIHKQALAILKTRVDRALLALPSPASQTTLR